VSPLARNEYNEFLVLLAQNDALRQEFERDPDAVLNRTHLSDSEKSILKSGHPDLIRAVTFHKRSGSLMVVGTGIQLVTHVTWETRRCIEEADRVLYAVAERATALWIESLNPKCESLDLLYRLGLPRMATYLETVERILTYVRDGHRVCTVFYGHPGVFVYASHEAIRRARSEGYLARMLPSISAEDCLFADLGVDPGSSGYQCFEATDFLIHRKQFDPACSLVLWQIGVIGELGYNAAPNVNGLRILSEVLANSYGATHEVTIYQAAQYPITKPVIRRVPLSQIPDAGVTAYSTLYVPPLDSPFQR